jgi:hypothetical protein
VPQPSPAIYGSVLQVLLQPLVTSSKFELFACPAAGCPSMDHCCSSADNMHFACAVLMTERCGNQQWLLRPCQFTCQHVSRPAGLPASRLLFVPLLGALGSQALSGNGCDSD